MAKLALILSSEEVHRSIPYALICMTRYGSRWNTMRRKRLWKAEFTDAEMEAARKLFARSHDWLLGRGVPDEVMMTPRTFDLWQKLGNFCGSI